MKEKQSVFEKYDVPIISISFLITIALVICTITNPDGTNAVASVLYNIVTRTFGTPILIFVFIGLVMCGWIACSKYGNIRLGNTAPQFSTFSYVAMMVCSGFGSGTIYWSFLESASYMQYPPFGVEAFSSTAADWAIAYNFHHWGPVAWSIYCIASIPIAYAFHVRKSPTLRVSEICAGFVAPRFSKAMAKFVDYIYILSTVAGIAFFVALSAPVISAIISAYTGFEDGFALAAGVVIIVSVIYTCSSYIGIEKGMKKLSDWGIYLVIIFFALVVILGDPMFIVNQTTSGIAYFMQNVVLMSLYTDAVSNGGFPQDWTVFFWSYWFIYAPFMGVFVSRISKGRTLREVIVCMILGGGTGTGIFLAALNAFSINVELTGAVSMSGMLSAGQGEEAIVAAISTLPGSTALLILLTICMLILLATTLDGSAFSLATNAQKKFAKGSTEPSNGLRVFWCIALTLLPFALMYVEAPVSTIQTCSLIFSLPIMLIIFIMVRALLRDMKADYGAFSAAEIAEKNKIVK